MLLVALIGVVTAQAMCRSSPSWEVMAVSAYLLVMFESEQAEVRRAGLIYIVLTHVSTLALIGMFAALSVHAEGRTFADFAAGNQVASTARTLALGLALVGFGLKAGAVPLHFWLPGRPRGRSLPRVRGAVGRDAQGGDLRPAPGDQPAGPAAGLVRAGRSSGWGWSPVCSACCGPWRQHDLKRLLAYHSVENIGIILLGMGVGVLGADLPTSRWWRCWASPGRCCTR